jgi:hypothetical protein
MSEAAAATYSSPQPQLLPCLASWWLYISCPSQQRYVGMHQCAAWVPDHTVLLLLLLLLVLVML